MKRSVSLASPLHKAILVLLTLIPLLLTPMSQAASRDDVEFSQAELDQMLAPIALYPDALLSQVLIASTYPLEVIQADRWVRNNKDLKTEDALKFAQNKDWDPSVKALVAFPDVLKRMSEDVDWTQRLGDAFLNDEESVMDAVQRLRKRAYATGNLEKAQHISVERDDDNIVIEPAEERIVYVPVYDTRVVYGNWWWPDYPPVYWHYPSSYTYVSGFYWGTSIYLGPTYFYSSCRWRDRRVVVIDHRNYVGPTRFYTGRDIVRHADARDWHHDPVHRHGVAYYNNSLRETYGSRHESRGNDRDYRRQFNQGGNPNPRGNDGWNRNDDNRGDNHWNNNGNSGNWNNGGNNNGHIDRAEQVRERLDRENSLRDRRPWSGDRSDINPRVNTVNNSGIRVQNQTPQPTLDNSPSAQNSEEAGRNRSFNQEHRVVTDGGDRHPSFSRPEQSQQEAQRPNIGEQSQRVERQEQPRVEMPAPRNEAEGRAQFERRTESLQNRSRFSREKNDDNTK